MSKLKERIKIDSSILSFVIILTGFLYFFPDLYSTSKAFDVVLDCLENGDTVLVKDKLIRVPMKGRDAAVVSGITQDKARVQMGLATSIVGKGEDMQALAMEFQKISQQCRDHKVVAVQDKEID